MQQITLSDMLANEVKTNGLDEKLARLIETVAACGVEISSEVACGALMGVLGMAGSENVQGEEQKKLDVISNDIVTKAVLESGVVAACASEEMDHLLASLFLCSNMNLTPDGKTILSMLTDDELESRFH